MRTARAFCLVLACSLVAVSADSALGQRAPVQIKITNYSKLSGLSSGFDKDLAKSLARALNDDELRKAAFFYRDDDKGQNPMSLILRLLEIVSPNEKITINSRNDIVFVRPIDDFNAFRDSLDFGRVVSSNAQRRRIDFEVDLSALDADAIHKRAVAAGRDDHDKFLSGRPGRFRQDEGGAEEDEGNTLLGSSGVTQGARVRVQFNATWVTGKVLKTTVKAGPSRTAVLINFDRPRQFRKALVRKSFWEHIKDLDSITLPISADRVRPATQPAAAGELRTWTDKSGKFSIKATLSEVDGPTAVLVKEDGKEVEVPVSRLSDEDQQYLASLKDAPSSAAPAASANGENFLTADRSKSRTLKPNLGPWEFTPNPASPPKPLDAARTLVLKPLNKRHAFDAKVEGLFLSPSGERAVVVRSVDGAGTDDDRYFEMLAPARGAHAGMFKLPKESFVLDVLIDKGMVLLRPEIFGHGENTRLYVRRLRSGELKPFANWIPHEKGRTFGRPVDIKQAWFLPEGRVMTLGERDSFSVWDPTTAKCLYEIPIKSAMFLNPALSADRRLLAFVNDKQVELFDLAQDKHVGSLDLPDKFVQAHLAIKPDHTALAAISGEHVYVWDLRTGDLTHEFDRSEITHEHQVDWVDDCVLVGGKYLYDLERKILLWEFQMPTSHFGRFAYKVAGGRLWRVSASDGYLATSKVPPPQADQLASSLPSYEELLICKPGDSVKLELDVDKAEQELRQAVTAIIEKNGWKIAESSDVTVRVTFKQLPQQEIRVNTGDRFQPKKDDIVTRTISPHKSEIEVLYKGKRIVHRGGIQGPAGTIWMNQGETLDDALRRITSPNPEIIKQAKLPSHLTKPGDATRNGAYGTSKLGQDSD